jgi:hypothetical protein
VPILIIRGTINAGQILRGHNHQRRHERFQITINNNQQIPIANGFEIIINDDIKNGDFSLISFAFTIANDFAITFGDRFNDTISDGINFFNSDGITFSVGNEIAFSNSD